MNSCLIYQIIIQPILMILEFLYRLFFIATKANILQTIILISFMVSAMCLPLYLRADAISEETNNIKKKLAARVNSIKKNFKGDERQFLLQTYYRQNNYHPISDLKMSFSLLLQIPFFFGAYYFFNHCIDLSNIYLPFLGNYLSKPDEMIVVGNVTINALPILMTLVNIFAGYIYAKDKSFKENLNLYIISLVFLVILYNQPSGLVLYWLFNNVFSLLKNIFLKFTASHTLLKYTGMLVLFTFYLAYRNFNLGLDVFVVALLVYLAVRFINCIKINIEVKNSYMISLVAFFVLTGLFIPSNVIASSPAEFASDIVHPINILYYPVVNAFGMFVFWGGVLWMLADKNFKKILNILGCFLFFFAVVNVFFAAIPKAALLSDLNFASVEKIFVFDNIADNIIYFSVLFVSFIIIGILFIKNKFRIINKILLGIICTSLLISLFNVVKIYKTISRINFDKPKVSEIEFEKYFHFSKTHKNVLVIFLDRAINSYFPLILKERPELNEMYSGFTYYPNTLSFYSGTVFGYPPIMGGYDYSPIGMAKTDDIYEVDHNKAISVLPLIFKNNGWNVTVTDVPWFDYETKFVKPDEVYTKNGITYAPVRNNLTEYFLKLYDDVDREYIKAKRNFIYYSISMIFAGSAREYIYNSGRFLNPAKSPVVRSIEMITNYAELEHLPKLTDFNSAENTLLVLNNDLVHTGYIFESNDYELSASKLINKRRELTTSVHIFDVDSKKVYHTFAASIIMLGEYFNYLKENGVYDNTKIIIVADHGGRVNNPKINDRFFNQCIIKYNPLLLVKDFNSKGLVKTSNEFMTNADVPSIATKNLIDKPVNPYTKKLITQDVKKKGIYVLREGESWPKTYFGKKNQLREFDTFFFVKDNIFKQKNWTMNIPYSKIKEIEGLK